MKSFNKQLRYTHTLFIEDSKNSVLYNNTNKLNPYFVTGFTDGDGCFLINIRPNPKLKTGYSVELVFKINLHSKDRALLENIRNYFGVGTVTVRSDGYIQYWVGSLKDLKVIGQCKHLPLRLNHFDCYPSITQKWSDYQLFKQVVELMQRREHLTIEGLNKILSIKAVLNNGLTDSLNVAFPDIIPVIRPQVKNQIIPDPHWISGFVEAEGCFHIGFKNSSNEAGGLVKFRFLVTQHTRDAEVLKNLVNYLGCGKYSIRSGGPLYGDYLVTKFTLAPQRGGCCRHDIKCVIIIIIPFFMKYQLQGAKSKEFLALKVVQLMENNNASLTKESFEKIKQMISRKNSRIAIQSPQGILPQGRVEKRSYSTARVINKEPVQNKTCVDIKFNQWLAGLIDADGHFHCTKKGSASLKIVMYVKDKSALYEIKHKYGGSVKSIAGSNALKYKIQDTKGLINLINDVNGFIRNPIRMLQLNKICVKYNIELKEPRPLTYNDGWFSGFVDGDGSIHIDEKSGQLSISVTQNNKYLLEPLQKLYVGKINIISSKGEVFKYTIFRKNEVLNLVDDYFKKYPLKSGKAERINLIKDFYHLSEHRFLNVKKIEKFNQWIRFKDKWDKT
jgi:hypothetical protein